MVYIHIPYCRSFCTYCDFYSEIPVSGFEEFGKAVCAEIRQRAGEITAEHNTLYIGGGTPSVLPPSVLYDIVSELRISVPECSGGFTEFTVEVNPDDIVSRGHVYAESLLKAGVDRVSMGVQSFDDRVLRWMNRRHDSETAVKAYRILREAGIENISIDLIFGYDLMSVPGMMTSSYGDREIFDHCRKTVYAALEISGDGCPPKHISAYQMSVEDGSALACMLRDGRYREAPENICAGQYEILCGMLADAGYDHYEISNFALSGFEAKHNSAYWSHIPYVGIGPAAHSLCVNKDGVLERRWNVDNINSYICSAESGNWGRTVGSEVLTEDMFRTERIMLALRTSRGIEYDCLKSSVSMRKLDSMMESGKLVPAGQDCLRIPEKYFFISDSIISELI